MTSIDYDVTKMQLKLQYTHQRHHTMAANPVPTYVNRTIPTYSVSSREPASQPNDVASPRYSPGVQPWRRQQAQSSFPFVPSTSPRPGHAEYTTSQARRPGDRGPACISPFRSVRKMKEPFQLRLPASPSLESNCPSPKESRVSPRLAGDRTLRAWRSDQNIVCTSLETFGLLPSPPLSDCRDQPSPSSAYFSSKAESEPESDYGLSEHCNCLPGNACKHCRTHKEPKNKKGASRTTNVHMAHSNLVKQWETDDGKFTPVSSDSERMSSPAGYSDLGSLGKRNFSGSSNGTQRSRSGTVSSEGSWVPSSLSYCETWLQGAPMEAAEAQSGRSNGFNRRKFQIVQKSSLLPDWKRAPDDVMLASVASKSKPKLVDISRQSSPAMSCSLPTPSTIVPSTPDIPQPEVSAFSPDTPMDMSDSGYITHNPGISPKGYQDGGEDVEFTDPGSAKSGAMSKMITCEQPSPGQGRPKSPPQRPNEILRATPSPQIQASSGGMSPKSEQEELEKWWDHEWTINQLENSVKDFPQNMPRLTSPVIMFIRHKDEIVLTRHFRKIFPNAPENLLDGLCAALIAQNYVASLTSIGRTTSTMSPPPNFSKLDTVPEKASSILGMKFAQPCPSRIRDRVLGSRNLELQKNLERIIDKLLFTISGPPDEKLKAAILVLIQVLETKP